jgi:tetratricopeptide (TPR) repeat protein
LVKKSINADSSNPRYHNNFGLILQATGKDQQAKLSFQRAIKLDSKFADAINNLGMVLQKEGNYTKAENLFQQTLLLQPESLETWCNLGGTLTALEKPIEAKACYQRAIEIMPDIAIAHFGLGIVYTNLAMEGLALDSYMHALTLDPNLTEVHQNVGIILMELGRFEEAVNSFRNVLRINPESAEALCSLSRSIKFDSYNQDVEIMEKLFSNLQTSKTNRLMLGFALGKIFEDLKSYKKAFEYFAAANQLKRQTFTYSIESDEHIYENIIATFDLSYFSTRKNLGSSDPTPIFVIGMPRSGTSLVEQILSAHSEVHGAGELPDLSNICFSNGSLVNENFSNIAGNLNFEEFRVMANKYLERMRMHSANALYITDKMPENFFYVGMIKVMFPNAKIIHCRRDPMDTCLSNFKNNFEIETNYAYDQSELGRYYIAYAKLMAHWRQVLPEFIYDVQYEDLVAHPEQEIRRMLSFCDLEFDASCLNFHQSKRTVKTASLFQVRQPLYNSSVKSWMHYEQQLIPLRLSLADII